MQIPINNHLKLVTIKEFFKQVGLLQNLSESKSVELIKKATNIPVYKKGEKHYTSKQDIEDFIENHMSFNMILENSGISSQTLRKIIRRNNITFISLGNTYDYYFMRLDDIKKYIYCDSVISGYKLLEILSINKKSKNKFPRRALQSVIDNIEKDKNLSTLIGYVKLDYPLYFKNEPIPTDVVFTKNSVHTFLKTHISFMNCLNESGYQRSTFVIFLSVNDIKSYTFYSNYEFKFISLQDYELFIEKRPKLQEIDFRNEFYTREQIKSLLKVSSELLKRIFLENEILPVDNRKIYFDKAVIDKLKDKQNELLTHYNSHYYTMNKLKRISENAQHLIYQAVKSEKVKTIECPLLLRGIYKLSINLYSKVDVDSYLKQYRENKNMQEITMSTPFSEFVYKTEVVLNIHFPESLSFTKTLWYDFVKKSLTNTHTLDISERANIYSRITATLVKNLNNEIYNYSPFSLNKIIFNEKSTFSISYQKILYNFYINVIKSIDNKLDKNTFNIDMINNPENYENTRKIDLSRYTYDEYINLYKYANNTDHHKKNAIRDVIAYLSGSADYNHYDSYWVYVLVHLTNNWRHSTIISEIPEIELPNTRIYTLEWLSENNISIEEANSIIYQIGRKLIYINKTDAHTEFRIGEPLKIAFATAMLICQIRKNMRNISNSYVSDKTGPLLWLNKKQIIKQKYTVHKLFFSDFTPNFHFQNRKMNRTLTTLIWSVSKSLKAAQISRSHYEENSTLHYIKFSDDQLDTLISQLFDRSSFGYISQLLTQKIFESKNISKEEETLRMNVLTKKFGDVQKIEVSTGIINLIAQQQEDIIKFINGLSHVEARELYAKSLTNTLFSKQKYFQCVFSECKYNNTSNDLQDCTNCPYSIINVYALSNMMDLYLGKILDLINKFEDAIEGEKKKMANHFYLIWRQIQVAKQRFGDVIYDFVDGGKERFEFLASELPKTKSYLTSSFKENEEN